MIEQKYIEWIHKELDGLNTPQESEKLKTFLSNHPEAQDYYHHLLKMNESLQQIGIIEPSPNVKKSILNAIDWKKYSVNDSKNPFLQFSAFKQLNFKYATIFVFGLVLGMIGYGLLSDSIKKTSFYN